MGAGVYQLPLIKKAKDLGLYVIVVSIPGRYPGLAIADRVYEVDTRDGESVCRVAKEEKIDGIATTGTDVASMSIGKVCEELGVPGISMRVAETFSDKLAMKKALSEAASVAEYRSVSTVEEAQEAAEAIGYPVVLKPLDLSGSRGISKVNKAEEIPDAWDKACSASKKRCFLVEEFIEGTEIGLDIFVESGEVKAFFPHDKQNIYVDGIGIPAGHSFPCSIDSFTERRLRDSVSKLIRASDLGTCAMNADIMITKDGTPYFIEVGARCGATCIPELIQYYSGIDYYAQILNSSLGEELDFSVLKEEACQARLLFSRMDGMVNSIDYNRIERLKREKGLDIKLDIDAGDRVRKVTKGSDRIGHVIASGKTTITESLIYSITDCIEILGVDDE